MRRKLPLLALALVSAFSASVTTPAQAVPHYCHCTNWCYGGPTAQCWDPDRRVYTTCGQYRSTYCYVQEPTEDPGNPTS